MASLRSERLSRDLPTSDLRDIGGHQGCKKGSAVIVGSMDGGRDVVRMVGHVICHGTTWRQMEGTVRLPICLCTVVRAFALPSVAMPFLFLCLATAATRMHQGCTKDASVQPARCRRDNTKVLSFSQFMLAKTGNDGQYCTASYSLRHTIVPMQYSTFPTLRTPRACPSRSACPRFVTQRLDQIARRTHADRSTAQRPMPMRWRMAQYSGEKRQKKSDAI